MTAVLLLAVSRAAPPDAKSTPLEGVWKIEPLESGGAAIDLDRFGPADRYSMVVVGDRFALFLFAGTITVDAAKKTADLTITEG